MSRAYIAGVGRHLPNAAVTFDRFHVVQLANAALEEVRRAEVRSKPALKHSRWMWLKDKHSWTKRQMAQHHELSRMHLKTGRAFRMKETLRDIFATTTTRAEAEEQLTAWFRWARRSKLAPFKKLALTLKDHWVGILNGFDSALNNGSEARIQAAKARARAITSFSWLLAQSQHLRITHRSGAHRPGGPRCCGHDVRRVRRGDLRYRSAERAGWACC